MDDLGLSPEIRDSLKAMGIEVETWYNVMWFNGAAHIAHTASQAQAIISRDSLEEVLDFIVRWYNYEQEQRQITQTARPHSEEG